MLDESHSKGALYGLTCYTGRTFVALRALQCWYRTMKDDDR